MLNRELKDKLAVLRDEGYAVVIFTPEELQGAPEYDVESALVAEGWDTIELLKKKGYVS